MLEFSHKPVMLQECMNGLNLKKDGIYFDGTVGGGGHSYEILKRTSPFGRVIATDLDDEAIRAATGRLSPFEGRFAVYKSNYKDFERVFDEAGIDKVDGALLDFGVSSHQIDDADRGFSYRIPEAPLDMRLDQTAPLTAEIVLNTYSEEKLAFLLKTYGEESFAKTIARNIVKERERRPFKTCGEFAEVVRNSIPAKFRFGAPCERKSFQAIRIAVNDELAAVREMMDTAPDKLRTGGRLCVISFHSLEDRIVKAGIARREHGCTCPREAPVCTCGFVQTLRSVSRKPILPGEEELASNPRARSAKLRVAERV